MNIHWGSLLAVFVVSLSSTVMVVALVTLAMLGLSARTAAPGSPAGPAPESGTPSRHLPLSPRTGTALATACLAAATLIVLFGLWEIVAR